MNSFDVKHMVIQCMRQTSTGSSAISEQMVSDADSLGFRVMLSMQGNLKRSDIESMTYATLEQACGSNTGARNHLGKGRVHEIGIKRVLYPEDSSFELYVIFVFMDFLAISTFFDAASATGSSLITHGGITYAVIPTFGRRSKFKTLEDASQCQQIMNAGKNAA